jgi:HPt (histidine-containing phosphotransfer) domain-containing protein
MAITRDIFDRLRQATADKPEVLAELVRDYLSEARTTLEQLRAAVSVEDAATVRERAHYLKGSSMMIGAGPLSRSCATLEQMGRDGDLQDAQAVWQQTVQALDAVESELSSELGSTVVPIDGPAN